MVLHRAYPDRQPEQQPRDIKEGVKEVYLPLFPNADQAPLLLYKKIWVQMNRIKNELTISVGDMYNLEEQALLVYDFDNDYPNNHHDSWRF